MNDWSRRDFMSRSAKSIVAFGTAAGTMGRARRARADAANDKIVMGIIGLGGRGRDHGRGFCYRDDVEIKYVCDPDRGRIGSFPGQLARIQDKPVADVQDMRVIFDDPDVDAVCVATCDHWHGLATVWACQAGKDVYVEKPASHNIWEGRKMVEAARKYGRVVQTGTQNRSAPYIQAARERIVNGKIGAIPLIKVYNMKPGMPFRCPADSAAPDGVDYGLYLGPAPERPFNEGHFHNGWKHWWAYSGGDMADDGVHQLDIARLLLGDPGPPRAVNASGGKVAFPGADGDVPDTQVVSFEWPGTVMTFELTEYTPYMRKTAGEIRDTDAFPFWPTNSTRIEIYGTRELLYVGRHGGGWQVMDAEGRIRHEMPGRQTTREHQDDFIEAVRSRRAPNADIEQGHQSALLVHLGNIGTALGGRRLEFDAATERVTNDAEADAHLLRRRPYRGGFELPETV
jgi:predicted dehydrogenase